MPTADDLFRPTVVPDPDESADGAGSSATAGVSTGSTAGGEASGGEASGGEASATTPAESGARSGSGRVKHDEKMTVYVTSDELLDLELARLTLRRHHALAVDRGRLVRAAVALALADLDEHGEDSVIVQRLRQA
jgi:hypothetical protein